MAIDPDDQGEIIERYEYYIPGRNDQSGVGIESPGCKAFLKKAFKSWE